MRMAWINMLRDYDSLNNDQFNQRCQQGLTLIFDSAFQNIALFQHLIEDRPRFSPKIESKGLGNLISEIHYSYIPYLRFD